MGEPGGITLKDGSDTMSYGLIEMGKAGSTPFLVCQKERPGIKCFFIMEQ